MFPELPLHAKALWQHHGEAVRAPRLRPTELPVPGLFIALLYVSKVHFPPLLCDAPEGENRVLLCLDPGVAGKDRSSISS